MVGQRGGDLACRWRWCPHIRCPSVELAEACGQASSGGGRADAYVAVQADKQRVIPACTHVDGSARPQTVHRDLQPRYWALLSEFESITGVPVVLNTSFNLAGEPIVHTPADALSVFERSGLDALVVGDFFLRKPA